MTPNFMTDAETGNPGREMEPVIDIDNYLTTNSSSVSGIVTI